MQLSIQTTENLQSKVGREEAVNELSKVFSYKFNNENLLRQAFTRHAFQIEYGLDSCSEELEFLGDSILSTVVTKEMFKQLTNHDCISFDSPFRSRYDEGELTKIRQKFVSKEALAARARELGLGKYILYGTGEQETDSSLEDMMEALIGAAVLDSEWDMQAIEKLVDELVCIQLDKSDALLEKSNYDELNRWHQKHFGCIPTYKVHDEGNGWYLCEITYIVPGNPTAASLKADGKTRGSAREEAANKVVNLLMYYGLWKNLSEAHIEPDLENSINQLQELYQKKYLDEKPEYEVEIGKLGEPIGNGDINIAKKLALTAKECGAGIVKYQTIDLDSIVSKNAAMAEYQKQNIGKSESQKDMLRKLILTYDEFAELKAYCDEIGIEFLSTPFEIKSVDFLEKLGCNILIPLEAQSQTRCFRSLAEVTKEVPSPARASVSGLIYYLETDCCRNSRLKRSSREP